LDVEGAARVVIHNLEDSLHADHAAGSSGSELLSEESDELVISFLDASVVHIGASLRLRQELHFDVSRVGESLTSGSSRLVKSASIGEGSVVSGRPVSLLVLVERGLLVGAKQVSVMVSSVGLACAHVDDLLRGASKRHGIRVVT